MSTSVVPSEWWTVAVLAACTSAAYALHRWIAPPLPSFLLQLWTGPQLTRELAGLVPADVHAVFCRDLTRAGHDLEPWLARLPPQDARHRVLVQALCSQVGLAFMYRWLVEQFAPWHLIPCHDSSTHELRLTRDLVHHTLRYRLRTTRGEAREVCWKVEVMVHFCPHEQKLLRGKVVAVPLREALA